MVQTPQTLHVLSECQNPSKSPPALLTYRKGGECPVSADPKSLLKSESTTDLFSTLETQCTHIKTLLDSANIQTNTNYKKKYEKDRQELCKAINKEIRDMKAKEQEIEQNNSKIITNTETLARKERIFKKMARDVGTHGSNLESLKVQMNMRQNDRVRIGPSALPFFHVPVRAYVFIVLGLCVALLGVVLFLLLRGGSAGGDASGSAGGDAGGDAGGGVDGGDGG